MGLTAGESEFDSLQGQELFLFSIDKTDSVAHITPISWVLWTLSLRREADHPPPPNAEVNNTLYLHSLARLHDELLN
jgi:hypothetical protein